MRCIIVGNGVAGMNTARLLREKNQEIEIEIITHESVPYYSRINLIEFLAGSIPQEKLFVFSPKWYEDRNIKVYYGTDVVAIDPRDRKIKLSNDEFLSYDYLVIAAGSTPFKPPVPNSNLMGIFTLRTLNDAIAIRDHAATGAKNAFVLGGGLLGIESAYSLKKMGLDVTILEPSERLLPKQLDSEGAAVLVSILQERGLKLILGTAVAGFCGEERVTGVQLNDGKRLPAELVLISAGVRPNLSCLAGSGIRTDRGILVDDQMRSNLPDIYAVGDVAQWNENVWGIVPVALNQAAVAAANIAGELKKYSGTIPSNTLKVMGVDLAVYGEAQNQEADCTNVRFRDLEHQVYAKIVLRDHCVIGAIVIGNKKMQNMLNKMVENRQRMDEEEAQRFFDTQMGVTDPSW
ncbi:MAG: FAD-dependent pyridine nucleotide-disulfide oxidoreductase [Firmicutes bacterium]|nr:FAD-dependent pyridine nucleotide-disulfide oxidoreductase [Bacillota bacterium]